MTTRALAGAALVAALLGCGAARAATHTVAIDGTAYSPPEIVVKVGDTVTWTNKDPFPHTVTARDGTFDSKSIDAGKSWRYVAGKRGSIAYYCTLHPNMAGTLKVE